MNTWSSTEFSRFGEPLHEHHNFIKGSYGEVKQAIIAMDNDIHNLSVCYSQIMRDLHDEKLEGGLRSLFIGNLVESYFTNLRSIYDYMATFPRIVCTERYLKQGLLLSTSFNDLLSKVDTHDKIEEALPIGVIWAVDQCRENFEIVKALRDAIIHQGKEPVITVSKKRAIYFKVPKQVGIYNSDDLVPCLLSSSAEEQELLSFLQLITLRLFMDMEKLGNAIAEVFLSNDKNQNSLMLYALLGLCMRQFMDFIFPVGRDDEFYKNALGANQSFSKS